MPKHLDSSALPRAARALGIEERGELVAVVWSFVYFFCLLSAYYMLRSVRESMAIVSGVPNIPWLFTATFLVMLPATAAFGWIASRYPRRTFLPWVYYFFILNELAFFIAFRWTTSGDTDPTWVARAFFVWLSVFNFFVVSVFWSFMADIYSREQSRRLFGIISAGGSAGAVLGPLITSVIVVPLGFENLLPLSAALLGIAVYCIHRLRRWSRNQAASPADFDRSSRPLGGRALEGFRLVATTPYLAAIAVALIFSSFLGAAMYMYMAEIVGKNFPDTSHQTRVFATIDACSNVLSFIGQLLVVKLAVKRLGIGMTLAIVPIVSVVGFALLAANPVFIVIAVFQVLRRGLGYGLTKPASDMLYSVVSREAKYKAKNFIETALWRGGDVLSMWTIRSIAGLGLVGVSLVCIPIALIWSVVAFWIGRDYRRRDRSDVENIAYESA